MGLKPFAKAIFQRERQIVASSWLSRKRGVIDVFFFFFFFFSPQKQRKKQIKSKMLIYKKLSLILAGVIDKQVEVVRARSQILVYGLTGRALGGRSAAPGAGFCGQNLGIKYIPCVGTHL